MSTNEPIDEENVLALDKPVEEADEDSNVQALNEPVEDEFEEIKADSRWSRRTKLALAICVLLMVVIGVVLGVTLAPKANNQGTTSAAAEFEVERSEQQDEPLVDAGEQPAVVQSPPSLEVQSPPSEVQMPPSEVQSPPTEVQSPVVDKELAKELTKFFVIDALNVEGCTNANLLRDPTTSQGEVVELIVEEIIMAMDYNEDGTFFIPLNMGKGYIQDRYALIRLYQEAGGEQWITETNWMSPMSQCSWFGVADCVPYTLDNCGVRALSLDTNYLGGSLPQDLCCMKCLQTISLIGPSVSSASSPPQCLASSEVQVNIMPISELASEP